MNQVPASSDAHSTETNLRYRQVFEDNHLPMFVRARESLQLLAVNQAACSFYGYSHDAFLALAPLDIYPEALHTDMWTYFDSISDEERVSFDTTNQTSSGTAVPVHVSLTRISWDGIASNFVIVEDISERLAALSKIEEQARILADSEARYRNIFKENLMPMLVLDRTSLRFVDVNSAACEYYGYSHEEFLGIGPLQWYPPADRNRVSRNFTEQHAGSNASFDTVHLKSDGSLTDVHISILCMPWGEIDARLVMVQDLSERVAAITQLQAANAALKRAQRIAGLGDWSVDLQSGERRWSDEVFRILGLPKEDGIPQSSPPHGALFSPEDLLSMDLIERRAIETRTAQGSDHQVLRRDGTTAWIHQELIVEFDDGGQPRRILGTIHDISDRKDTESRLASQARVDALTGLPNRKAVSEALAAAIATAKRSGVSAAMLFIDVDQFKNINDTLGHTAGDSLLQEIATRLRKSVRASDFVGRMGGDEFVVILPEIHDPGRIAKVAEAIQLASNTPVHLERDVIVTVSIGIAVYPEDGTTVEALTMNADTAMYYGKRAGRSTYRFFSPEMHAASEETLRLDMALREAVANEAFSIRYQPIVSANGSLVGASALVHWPQSAGAPLLAEAFIPHAEETGLIVPLGAWILRTACADAAQWNGAPDTRVRVNISVSAKQVAEPFFAASVMEALSSTGLRPELLEIELTELAICTAPGNCTQAVARLRELGVRIALDDFGTGYNSLLALHSLQIDTLKLDKRFVAGIAGSTVDRAIASAVISAARTLGASALAEDVERVEQRTILEGMGYGEMQGSLFAEPMSGGELALLVARSNRRPDRELRQWAAA